MELEKEIINKEVKDIKKRGRKKKEEEVEYQETKDKNKFFIDVSKNQEQKEMVLNLLRKVNEKSSGREIILKDLVIPALSKLTEKDLKEIQESSLTEMEKVDRALEEYNKKNNTQLKLGEFLVKRLGIN